MGVGLILEGGGMRGVYTTGVLDCLMDHEIWMDTIYGVSAGACHACSYASRQRGRAAQTVLDHAGSPRYMGIGNLLKTGNFFGVDYIYRRIPEELHPFDHEAYLAGGASLYSVVFNCRTGEAAYPLARDLRRDMPMILASSSLPLLSRMVLLDGEPYLDGGILDSIPVERSIADGNRRNVVVLTQHRGYRKGPNRMMPLIRARYRRYPMLVKALAERHEHYNRQTEAVYREEAAGNAFVLQPSAPVTIGRIERDRQALEALYRQGYQDAERQAAALKVFLGM